VYLSASTVKHGEPALAVVQMEGKDEERREGTRGTRREKGWRRGRRQTNVRAREYLPLRHELTISGRTGSVFRRPVIELVTYLRPPVLDIALSVTRSVANIKTDEGCTRTRRIRSLRKDLSFGIALDCDINQSACKRKACQFVHAALYYLEILQWYQQFFYIFLYPWNVYVHFECI